MTDSLEYTLAKVVAATAWADGEVTLDEINCMKDLLFRVPNLTERDWERLEMYIDSPVGDDERARLVGELSTKVQTAEDKQLVEDTLEALVQADGELTEDEREVFTEVISQVGNIDTGFFSQMGRLVRPSMNRRSEALENAPNREDSFDDYINNRIYYEIKLRTGEKGVAFDLSEAELRKLSLAGGIVSIVARVDRKVTPEEVSQISDGMKRGWELSQEEADLVAEIVVSDITKDLDFLRLCWNLFDVTTQSERLRFLDALFNVAAADGRVTNDEIEEIRLIANSLKMTHKEFIDAKLKIPRELRDS